MPPIIHISIANITLHRILTVYINDEDLIILIASTTSKIRGGGGGGEEKMTRRINGLKSHLIVEADC